MRHFADRLADAVRSKGNPLCVGIDPRVELLPVNVRRRHAGSCLEAAAAAVEAFGLRVIELIADVAPVVKPQAAFFELLGPAGMAALRSILTSARAAGLLTILDAKRGDIAGTATAYADAAFDGAELDGVRRTIWNADAVTVNPYLGRDAVEPFLTAARRDQRGVFVLVRTSNPGAGLFQDLICDGEPVYQRVGREVAAWGRDNLGDCGYGDVAAVVGATAPAELAALRAALPNVWFLVPGYGAQGGTASDVAAAFRDGLGAVVNSSRGVTFPFQPGDADWEGKIRAAARSAADELADAAKR